MKIHYKIKPTPWLKKGYDPKFQEGDIVTVWCEDATKIGCRTIRNNDKLPVGFTGIVKHIKTSNFQNFKWVSLNTEEYNIGNNLLRHATEEEKRIYENQL